MRELFDISKIIFERPEEWEDVTPGEKRKFFFLLNRRFAIQFPLQANALQHLKINQVAVMDFWQHFMRKKYKETPYWMYTKEVKKAKETKEKKTKVSENTIIEYCKFYKKDKKSVYDALEFYNKDMVKELKLFEKLMK